MASNKSANNYEYVFKIVLVGDSGVGKSSFLLRFAVFKYIKQDDLFTDNYITTLGVDFVFFSFIKRFKTLIFNDKVVKWDTAGQERYRSITNAYYRGADAIVIVFDITNRDSFYHINDWILEISKYAGQNICKLIIGNKYDLISDKKISNEEIHDYENLTGIKIVQTSAKLSYQVETAMKYVIDKLMERGSLIFKEDQKINKEEKDLSKKLQERDEKQNKGKACC